MIVARAMAMLDFRLFHPDSRYQDNDDHDGA
jgi:hypothetical protein